MKPWSQDFLCSSCEHRFNLIIERDDKEKPVPCEIASCAQEARPVFSMPLNLRRSFHDGVKRKGFAELRTASELEGEAFSKPLAERGEIMKEVDKLRKSDGKGGVS